MQTKTALGPARILIIVVAALFFVTAAATGWAAGGAADFTMKAVQDGKDYSLSQFKGKVVLINFFTFTCGPCREEMPHLSKIYQDLKGQGFQTLGIGLASTPEQLKQLSGQLNLAYPVLVGNDGVAKAYGGVELVPLTFIIDKQGNIAHKILGARSQAEFEKMIKPLL
jgi:peroxiredoxin